MSNAATQMGYNAGRIAALASKPAEYTIVRGYVLNADKTVLGKVGAEHTLYANGYVHGYITAFSR